ncbi:MFS transporter [Microbacterium sp. RD1]|uniref:MFS transporter n=1 Tax=Microbacterium sp. RD1 TaxID=3457313 RepID=UPI003FA56E20
MTNAEPVARLSPGRVLLLAALNLVALGSLTAPAVAGLPVAFAALVPAGERATVLATALALGSLTALVTNPVFGWLSDRTPGRLGRRRPWLIAGAVVGAVAIGGLATADSIAALTTWWVLAQAAYNAVLAASAALLADLVPEEQRASASGLFTAGAFVGALPPLLLATLVPSQLTAVSFVMPGLALVAAAASFALPDRGARPPRHGERPARVRVPRAFVAVWVQRLAMQSAFALATAFTLYLIVDRMTGDAVAATPVATLATLVGGGAIVVGALVGGAWASRRGRSLPFLVFGAGGLAVAALIRAGAATPVLLWVAAGVGGLAMGVYLSANLALALRTLPPGRGGSYLGMLNVAETVPGVIAPGVAALLLRIGGADPIAGPGDDYVALYLTAAALALLSLATLPALGRALSGTRETQPTERDDDRERVRD